MEQTQSLTAPPSTPPEPPPPAIPPPSTTLDPQTQSTDPHLGAEGRSYSQSSHVSSNLALSQNARLATDSGLSSGDEIQDFDDDLLW